MQRRPELSPEFILAHRRRRFVVAGAEIAHEFGLAGVTTTTICQVAHTARNTFYDTFANVPDCLRSGANEAAELLFAPVRAADGRGAWLSEVDAAIAGFYAAVGAEPLLAELLFLHWPGLPSVERNEKDPIEAGIIALAELLDRGADAAPAALLPMRSELAGELFARAIVSLATRKLGQEDQAELPTLGRGLTLLIGDSFLGPDHSAATPAGAGAAT